MGAMLRIGSIIAIGALVAVAVAILVPRISGGRTSRRQTHSVIMAALKASGFAQEMPAKEAKRKCIVRGGGPAPGVSYPGAICGTRVLFSRRGTANVYFTHWISGKPHTWLYRVSPSLHARFLRDFGPGPAPENMA